MNLSKAVTHGTFVAKRGDKYIRCGRRAKLVGVFQMAQRVVMITGAGRQTFDTPMGIVTQGPVKVQIADETKGSDR